jgi:hypothetical protein
MRIIVTVSWVLLMISAFILLYFDKRERSEKPKQDDKDAVP